MEENRKYAIARQLLKPGTSIGAHIKEVQNAESNADCIHKMKMVLKEVDKTEYGLFLCQAIETSPNCDLLRTKTQGILRILNKITRSSKRRK